MRACENMLGHINIGRKSFSKNKTKIGKLKLKEFKLFDMTRASGSHVPVSEREL